MLLQQLQAEAHVKELQQPQHVNADKAAVAEQPKFYTGPMDVDEATMVLAEQINQTYWDSPGQLTSYPPPSLRHTPFHLTTPELHVFHSYTHLVKAASFCIS